MTLADSPVRNLTETQVKKKVSENFTLSSQGIPVAGNHFQVVSRGQFTDSLTRELVPFDHPKVRRRSRTAAVYELHADAITTPAKLQQVTARKSASAAVSRTLAAAKRLAAKHGITIEYEWDESYWVAAPDRVENHPDYPYSDEHVRYRDEVFGRVQEIVEWMVAHPTV